MCKIEYVIYVPVTKANIITAHSISENERSVEVY
jgi:hypothetical protein